MNSLKVEYDSDYGIDHRSGWSVTIDGCVYLQFRKLVVIALAAAFFKRRRLREDS